MGQPYIPRGSSGNVQGLHPDSGLARSLETFTCPGHHRLSVHSEATSNLLALSPDLLIASSNTWPLHWLLSLGLMFVDVSFLPVGNGRPWWGRTHRPFPLSCSWCFSLISGRLNSVARLTFSGICVR